MKLPERGRFEYNLNTFVLIGGIVIGIASTGATWGYFTSQLTSADRETKDWQTRHEQLHRERLQATTEAQAKTDQRIAQLEIDARKIENLAYRVTVAEQGALSTGKAIEQLSAKLSEQSTDLRVMREIIERQFGTSFQRPMRR